ncbi:MAG: RNA methyltransferase [Candidatus Omnitrophota bacterium]|nr:RNA methyltransferase [Candidatus Omnitrophota bacterium]MBU1894410.1 RNA methyltransferase [Candidatus Omnitrophota bacterium]
MIEKASKAKLKKIRQILNDKKIRDTEGVFAVEGQKIIKDLFDKNHAFDFVVFSCDFAQNNANKNFITKLIQRGVKLFETNDQNFEKISSLKKSQSILAVVKKPSKLSAESLYEKNALVIFCEGIQDPGNLGAIIRSATAFNAKEIVLTSKTVDMYNPKVIRASSGTVFDVPVNVGGYKRLDMLKKDGYKIFVSCANSTTAVEIAKVDKSAGPCVLVFGSEGCGVSKEVEQRADSMFTIDISKTVESLNVAAAVAISLYVFRCSRI